MKRKRTILYYMTRHEKAHRSNKIKSIIDFDEEKIKRSMKSIKYKSLSCTRALHIQIVLHYLLFLFAILIVS